MDKQKIAGFFNRNLLNFVVFASAFIFYQPFFDPFGPAQTAVIRLFIPLLIFVFLLKSYHEGRAVFKYNQLLLPFGLYLSAALISVFFSINTSISLKYLAELGLYIAGAYFIYNISTEKSFSRIIFFIIFTRSIMSFYGIMQHFDMDIMAWNTNFMGRPLGTIGNPDFFAGELLFSAFVLLSYAVYSARYRALSIAGLALHLICIYYTKVIGAYLGLAAGAAAFIVIYLLFSPRPIKEKIKRNKKNLTTAVIIILIAAVAGGIFFSGRIKSLASEKKRSLVHRLLMWESSLLMIKDSPLMGKGIGSFRLNYPLYQGKLLNDGKNNMYDYVVTWMPHQNYLLIASETGLLGLGFFLLGIFAFYAMGYRIYAARDGLSPVLAGVISGITAILGAAFFNTFYNIPATTLVFFTAILCLPLFYPGAKAVIIKKGGVSALLALSVCLLLFFAVTEGRTMAANLCMKKGDSYSKKNMGSEALGYFEKVIALKPVELCPQMDVAQYYFAAEEYRKAGDLKSAEKNYREDLLINPYCPEVNNMLGALLGQTGNMEECLKKLELAIYVAPHYDAAYTNLVTAYMVDGDYEKAKSTILRYTEKNGSKPEFENLLKAVDAARLKAAK